MATKKPVKRTAFNLVSLIFLFPIYLLSKLIPKDRKLYIFGSSLGFHFADNSKYLFLFSSEHAKDIRSVYISKNQEIVHFIKNKNMQAEYLYSFEGFKTVLRAKKAFISHSIEDIHPILIGGAEIIQLWHGTPLKRIGYDADWIHHNFQDRIKNAIRTILYSIFPYLYSSRLFDDIIASSDYICPSFMSAFDIPRSKISVAGQPRNDALSSNYQFNSDLFPEVSLLDNLAKKYSHIISWLPTHRKPAPISILDLMNDYNFDIAEFNRTLSRFNAVLLIKPHYLELGITEEFIKEETNILVYRHVDPYPLLDYTDVLITDYSSIFFDYLLLNRPIIFTPFDMDDYMQNNVGLYYDYAEVTPGPKCRNWMEVRREIEHIMGSSGRGKQDSFAEERLKISRLFNKYDSGFSGRIVDSYFD